MTHRRLWWIAAFVLALGAARANAAEDQRELRAREDFAAGRYQQALDAYAKLYAETVHPTYLRNIGRCYQNLGEPDKAISSFREYLRKRKTITAEERSEVEGYIAEMEELKKQRGGGGATTSEPSAAPSKSTSPSTQLMTAPEPKGGAATEALLTAPAKPPGEESSPVYTRWWFWTIVGAAVVGAGIGIAAAAGAFTKTRDAPCPFGVTCP